MLQDLETACALIVKANHLAKNVFGTSLSMRGEHGGSNWGVGFANEGYEVRN